MTEATETPESGAETLPSVGERLMQSRLSQGLSLGEMARQLKLSVKQVEALERDDYRSFPGPLWVRGFLRNYAKVLGLDAEALVAKAGLASQAPLVDAVSATPTTPSPAGGRERRRLVILILAFVVLGLFVLGLLGQRAGRQTNGAVSDGVTTTPMAEVSTPAAPAAPATVEAPVAAGGTTATPADGQPGMSTGTAAPAPAHAVSDATPGQVPGGGQSGLPGSASSLPASSSGTAASDNSAAAGGTSAANAASAVSAPGTSTASTGTGQVVRPSEGGSSAPAVATAPGVKPTAGTQAVSPAPSAAAGAAAAPSRTTSPTPASGSTGASAPSSAPASTAPRDATPPAAAPKAAAPVTPAPAATAVAAQTSAPAKTAAPASALPPDGSTSAAGATSTAAATPTTAAAAGTAGSPAASPEPAAPVEEVKPRTVRFTFTQSVDVRVVDANGKVLMAALQAAGTEKAVRGLPPLSVYVGNVHAVKVVYRGREVDLTSRGRTGSGRVTLK